jgi:membrane fusion protein (multidrug efflux system)
MSRPFLLSLLLLLACGGPSERPSRGGAGAPVEVEVVPAASVPWNETLDLNGTLAPLEKATLAAEIDGRVTSIRADLGARVSTGAILATLLDDEIRPATAQSRTSFLVAERDLDRVQRLVASSMASAAELDAAQTRRDVARAQADLAEARLARTVLRAPWPGAVASRLVSPGDFVRAGTPLFELVQNDPLRVRASVPEAWAPRVGVGLPIEILVDPGATDAPPLRALLLRVSPAVDAASRSFVVEAEIPNPDGRLVAGSFARVRLEVGAVPDATRIPTRALLSSSGVDRCFVIAEGRASERTLTLLGALDEDLVVRGLAEGERVAVRGAARLVDGAAVRVGSEASKGDP